MHHPFLYIHFEELLAVIDQTELLAKVLAVLNIIFDDLPDDQELATYYVLGACSRYSHEIADVMQRTNIESLTQAPEIADKLAKDFSLNLQEKYLNKKVLVRQELEGIDLQLESEVELLLVLEIQ